MLAIIAPGQGAQTPGMLTPWLSSEQSKTLLNSWSAIIDLDLLRLGTTADADEIKETANAQPLIVAAGLCTRRCTGSGASSGWSFSYRLHARRHCPASRICKNS